MNSQQLRDIDQRVALAAVAGMEVHSGIVSAVTPSLRTYAARIDGGTIPTPGIPYPWGAVPVIGDRVVIVRRPKDGWILGGWVMGRDPDSGLVTPDPTPATASTLVYNVRDRGALGNGVADDTKAIQAAIDAASLAGGGIVFFPPGAYSITSTLTVNQPTVQLIGSGRDRYHTDTPPWKSYANTNASTVILWSGADHGTMIAIGPGAGVTDAIGGVAVKGLTLVGALYPYTLAADRGLELTAVHAGEFDLFVQEFHGAGVIFQAKTGMGAGEGSCVFNHVTYLGGRFAGTAGCILKLTGNGEGDAYNNTFDMIDGLYSDGNAIDLGHSDSNWFKFVRVQRAAGGIGTGVLFRADAIASAHQHIFDWLYAGAGGVVAQGTDVNTFPATQNRINYYDVWENNVPEHPTIGPGATLLWKSQQLLQDNGHVIAAYPPGFATTMVAGTTYALAAVSAGLGGAMAVQLSWAQAMYLTQLEYWSTDTANLRTMEWALYWDQGGRSNNLARMANPTVAGSSSFTPTVASVRAGQLTGGPFRIPPAAVWLVMRNTSTAQTFNIGASNAGTFARVIARIATNCAALGASLDISGWTPRTDVPLLRLFGVTGNE